MALYVASLVVFVFLIALLSGLALIGSSPPVPRCGDGSACSCRNASADSGRASCTRGVQRESGA